MAVMKKLKKGGIARWVFKGATSGDFFVVPRGFRIMGPLTIENSAQLGAAGTLSLGRVPGVNDVYTITVTSAYTGTGTCTWGGGVVNAGTVISTAQATAIAALPGGVTGAAQLAASAAAIAANQPTLVGVYGNVPIFNVTASGANIILTGAVPGAATPAPTLSSTGAATFSAFVHTLTGSVDTTYMAATPINATAMGAVSLVPVIPPVTTSTAMTSFGASSTVTSSLTGAALSATFTTTNTSAGVLNINGQSVTVPYNATTALTAPQVGILAGGRSFYSATLAYVGSGNVTINGVTVASGGNIAATVAALNNAQIPGWIVIAATTTLYMCATRSGPTALPTIVTGGYITLTNVNSQVGFYIPGYVTDSTTPITSTTTFTTASTSSGVYAINGTPLNIPYINSTATAIVEVAAIAAGCAWWSAAIASTPGTTLTNFVNGVSFVPGVATTNTATNLAALVNIPGKPGDAGGWVPYNIGGASTVIFVAQNPGYMSAPTFSAGTGAVITFTGVTFNQGVTLSGYTSSYTASTAVWVGPNPVFTAPAGPSGTTTATVCTLAGSTGTMLTYVDQQNNPGASPPSLLNGATVMGGTTFTTLSVPADVPYYLNFSRPEFHGNVNVTCEIEKFS